MFFSIDDESLGSLEEMFAHKSDFHLVLNVFDTHSVAEAQPLYKFGQLFGIDGLTGSVARL